MNQRGETTLLSCFLLFTLMSIVLLCALELSKSFRQTERRSHLFLCVKEIKGEHHHFLKFMGRTNWGIKNINRTSLIMLFIPGLQGVASNAQKAKKYLQHTQELRLISYLKTLSKLKARSCPMDPRMLITPFKLKRNTDGALRLKEEKWTYYYFSKPYLISLKVDATGFESIRPTITYLSEESLARLSSLLSLR
jgi:hypothetical protein